jgi:mRNA interferase MazF
LTLSSSRDYSVITMRAKIIKIGNSQRFDVFLVNLDPTIGVEIKKTRPCLIISPDEMNRHISTVIVAPMTTI